MFFSPSRAGPLVHHCDEPLVIAADVPGDRLAGVIGTRHQHGGHQITQEKFLSGLEVVVTNDERSRALVDFHDFLQWRRFQRDQRSHDFREAGGREPAGRILLQQDAPGLKLDQIQGRCLDDRLLRQIGKRVFSEADRPHRLGHHRTTNSALPSSRLSIAPFAY